MNHIGILDKLIQVTCFLFFLMISDKTFCQEKVNRYTLSDVIQIAKDQSPDAILAKHRFRNSFWRYRTHLATFKPKLNLDATIPNINRSISKITMPDGSEAFISQSLANYSMDMSLSKTIGLTGGQIFMSSGLERIDIFYDSTTTSSFLSNPFTIGYNQPLLSYNQYKWAKRIEPMLYEESKKKYIEDVENISVTATAYFFDLLLAQINTQIGIINKANNDTLYKIAKGRYNYGKIAENELLQMELSLLNTDASVEESKIDQQYKLFTLKSYLRIKNNKTIELLPPVNTYSFVIGVQKAIDEAKKNRSATIAFDRRITEAQSKVNKAKAENRFNANLYALYGLTQSTEDLANVYENPQDQQRFSIGIQVPILDWGESKGRIKMAESEQEVVMTNVEQEQIDFEQEIFLKVMKFNMQKNQLIIAAKADTIGQKRYHVTKQRYLIGKIIITELNIALAEKDAAKRDYISALRTYWKNYYDIRKLTLYDFRLNKPISYDLDAI